MSEKMFDGQREKVLWNVSVIHEKRLKVLDQHVANLLENGKGDNTKELETINKKIDILAKFRSEFFDYKKDIKNIKNTVELYDTDELQSRMEELHNNKLSTIVYLNTIKDLRKTIKNLKKNISVLTNDVNILKLNCLDEGMEKNKENKKKEEDMKKMIEKMKDDINNLKNERYSSKINNLKLKSENNIIEKKEEEEKLNFGPNKVSKEVSDEIENIKETKVTKVTNETKETNNKNEKPNWLKYKVKKPEK